MADIVGAYHLADNPELYDVARSNNFEFVVTGLGELLRAGYTGQEQGAYLTNVEDVIRISTSASSVPHFSQDKISVRRGNSYINAAGVPTFTDQTIKLRDFIGADTKAAIMAWQNLSYDVNNQAIGNMANYKKVCYLIEYAPDQKTVIRQWELIGCFITNISEDDFDYDSTGDNKRLITATIVYDYYKLVDANNI